MTETASKNYWLQDHLDRAPSPPGDNNNHVILITNRNQWPSLTKVSETYSHETDNLVCVSTDTKADVIAVSPGSRQNAAKRVMSRLFCCLSPWRSTLPKKRTVRDGNTRSQERPRNLFRVRQYRMGPRLPSIPAAEDHLYSQVITPGSITSTKTVTTDDGGYETVVIQAGQREDIGQSWSRDTYEQLHRNEDYHEAYSHLKRPKPLESNKDLLAQYGTLDRAAHYEMNNYDHLQHQGRTGESHSVSIQDGIQFDSTVLITICLFGERWRETPV